MEGNRTPLSDIMHLTRVAVQHAGDDAEVLAWAAVLTGHAGRDLPAGLGLVERALAINPNSAVALLIGGQFQAYLGNTEAAISYLEQSARLNPFRQAAYLNYAFAVTHFVAGRQTMVLEFTEKALRDNPNAAIPLLLRCASLGLLGRVKEGRHVLQLLQSIAPDYWTISRVRAQTSLKAPNVLAAFCKGLRRAGMPE
jgi:adenylate cyclase